MFNDVHCFQNRTLPPKEPCKFKSPIFRFIWFSETSTMVLFHPNHLPWSILHPKRAAAAQWVLQNWSAASRWRTDDANRGSDLHITSHSWSHGGFVRYWASKNKSKQVKLNHWIPVSLDCPYLCCMLVGYGWYLLSLLTSGDHLWHRFPGTTSAPLSCSRDGGRIKSWDHNCLLKIHPKPWFMIIRSLGFWWILFCTIYLCWPSNFCDGRTASGFLMILVAGCRAKPPHIAQLLPERSKLWWPLWGSKHRPKCPRSPIITGWKTTILLDTNPKS